MAIEGLDVSTSQMIFTVALLSAYSKTSYFISKTLHLKKNKTKKTTLIVY